MQHAQGDYVMDRVINSKNVLKAMYASLRGWNNAKMLTIEGLLEEVEFSKLRSGLY